MAEEFEETSALDDLLSAMDEISPQECNTASFDSKKTPLRISSNDDSPINETLYQSAIFDQTWMHKSDSPVQDTNFESYRETNLLDFENDDDLTPVATPVSLKIPEISDNQLEDQIFSLKNRVESLQKELSSRKQPHSAESLRRVVALQSMLHSSPAESMTSDTSPNVAHSLPKSCSSSYNDVDVDYDSKYNSREKMKRFAAEPKNSSIVTELAKAKEKAKDVSNKLRRSISINSLHQESGTSSKTSSHLTSFDPFFGISVTNLTISSATFQAYVGDRKKVRLSQLALDKKVTWDDWVTMAVLVEKSVRRKSAKGNEYIIWKLCDLRDCQRLVRVFLFGNECIDKLFKIGRGSVLAVLNASPMPKQENSEKDDMFTLKIENAQKVLEIGSCPDFAHCKGTRKNDKARCTNIVNKSTSEFCDFHVMSAYKNFASKRGEFQNCFNKPPKTFEKNQMGTSGLTTVKIFPQTHQLSSTAKKIQTADLLSKISKNEIAESSVGSRDNEKTSETNDESDQSSAKFDSFVDLLRRPTIGSRNLLKQISHPNLHFDVDNKKSLCNSSGRMFLASYSTKSSSFSSVKNDLAKAKAVSVIQKKYESGLPKSDPNNAFKRPSIKNFPNTFAFDELVVEERSPLKKRQKLGDIEVNKDQLDSLLAKKSTHEDLVAQDDAERQEAYFKVMECKEKVEQRAAEMMEIKNCRVVTCKTCDYTWHAQSDVCKQFGHKVLWHNAEKKFFKCKQCKKRTIAYHKYPSKPCDGCKSTTFERVAMRDERRGPKLVNEQLKIRGEEEPFLR